MERRIFSEAIVTPEGMICGEVVVRDGEIVTMDMRPVIATHNRCAARLLDG